MQLETAFAHFFATALASSLFTIAAEQLLVASPSSLFVQLATALAIAIPLASHAFTYFSIKSFQHEVQSTSSNPPDPIRIFLVSFLSCASTIERYFFLSWIALGFRHYIYALGLIEIFIVLRLGVLFRESFARRSIVIEDVCEKGNSEFVFHQST